VCLDDDDKKCQGRYAFGELEGESPDFRSCNTDTETVSSK